MRRAQCAAWETGRSYWIVIAMASPDASAALDAAPFSYCKFAETGIVLRHCGRGLRFYGNLNAAVSDGADAAFWLGTGRSHRAKILVCRKFATLVNDGLRTGVDQGAR
ncbi:hypothetical protein GCM10023069_61600 [Shinella granuli]